MAAASTSVSGFFQNQYTSFSVAFILSIFFLPGTLISSVYQGHVKPGKCSLSFFYIYLSRPPYVWCAGLCILGSS